jgi:predicted phosphodiesterase
VLADARRRNVDLTYCLGDLVGYGPDPNGVIDLIRTAEIPSLMGNYDDGVGFERGSCGCFYADPEAERIGARSYEFTVRAVSADRKAYLRDLPREWRVVIGGRSLHLVHGSPRKINEYLLPDRDVRTFDRIAAAEAQEETDVLVFGHTHIGWHRTYSGVLFVNVGSAGKPSGGDPRAAYTLLRLGGQDRPQVQEVRVEYDVEETASAILAAGLPIELADNLRRGGSST